MTVMQYVGIVIGVLAAIIVFCIANMWIEKRYPSEDYDERQKLIQGRASSLGMGIGLIYLVVVMGILINQVDKEKTIEPFLLVLWGFLLPIMVDHTYCFIGQAALPLSQKPWYSIISYAILGTLHLWKFNNGLKLFPLSFVGKGTSAWIYLSTGICFLYLSLMHIIQYFRDRKERT